MKTNCVKLFYYVRQLNIFWGQKSCKTSINGNPIPISVQPHFLKPHLLHSKTIKLKPQLHTLYSNRTSRLSLTIITCSKLKTSKEIKNKDKNVSKKILLSNSAPPVVSEEIGGGGGGGGGGKKVSVKERSGALGFLKRLPRKVLAVLSILPLAIGEMFVIAVLMAPGM
jgi:cytochrome c biogenesis protein